jgi:hypothetical protein
MLEEVGVLVIPALIGQLGLEVPSGDDVCDWAAAWISDGRELGSAAHDSSRMFRVHVSKNP